MSNPNTVVFSHSSEQGYSQIDLSGIVADKETADWIGSYINSVTAFASNPKYLSAISCVNSFFCKNNYMIFLNSCTEKDNRLFLENSVTVNTVNSPKDYLSHIENNDYVKSINGIELSAEDRNELKKALLLAAVSDKMAVYCISDNDEILNGVRKCFFELPPSVVCRSSCIEAVGGIPELKAALVLCKCVANDDYDTYINSVKSKSNYIIIDCMGDKIRILTNIPQTTYAQRVVKHIADFNSLSVDDICISLHRTVRGVNGMRLFDYGIDKNTYFNTAAYFLLLNNYPHNLYDICATVDEKANITNYVSSRGI